MIDGVDQCHQQAHRGGCGIGRDHAHAPNHARVLAGRWRRRMGTPLSGTRGAPAAKNASTAEGVPARRSSRGGINKWTCSLPHETVFCVDARAHTHPRLPPVHVSTCCPLELVHQRPNAPPTAQPPGSRNPARCTTETATLTGERRRSFREEVHTSSRPFFSCANRTWGVFCVWVCLGGGGVRFLFG